MTENRGQREKKKNYIHTQIIDLPEGTDGNQSRAFSEAWLPHFNTEAKKGHINLTACL